VQAAAGVGAQLNHLGYFGRDLRLEEQDPKPPRVAATSKTSYLYRSKACGVIITNYSKISQTSTGAALKKMRLGEKCIERRLATEEHLESALEEQE
jgi:hypothetical protein